MRKNFEEFDLHKAQQLAQTEAGRQLIAMLQDNHSVQINEAMASAKAGNFAQTQQALAAFLKDPKAQALLRQLQEDGHG